METQAQTQGTRSPLAMGLIILVGLSLLVAVIFLIMGYPSAGSTTEVTIPITVGPGPEGSETGGATGGDNELTVTIPTSVTADDLRELALALAAVITAITGLFGIVATQIWRRREEDRADKSLSLTLERERLEMERERLQLERERLELEQQRKAILGET